MPVSTLFVTTALFNELAAANGRIFQRVKQVLFGGEAVNPESVRRVLESGGPPGRLLHVYGPTECTTFATFYLVTECARRMPRPFRSGGRFPTPPLTCSTNTEIRCPSEFPVSSISAVPAWRRAISTPELTGERFVADPFARRWTQRLYRTGDIVKYLPRWEH